jgi:hypothetical protein
MDKAIQNALKWLEDPVLSKLAGTLVAVVVVVAIVQVIKRVATRYIHDKAVRYRAREAIGFIGNLPRRVTKHLLSAQVLKPIDASGGAVSVASSAIEIFPKAPLDIRQLAA